MIEWLLKIFALLFRSTDARATESLSKALEGSDRLSARLESRLMDAESRLDAARLELADCLLKRIEDAHKIIEIEALLDTLEPPYGKRTKPITEERASPEDDA